MGLSSTNDLAPGARVTLELSGTITLVRTEAIFREALIQNLQMSGVDVESVTVTTGGVLEAILGLATRPYKAVVIVRTLASSNVSSLVALVSSAAENSGSYTPAVTIPSIGQASQPSPAPGLAETLGDELSKVPGSLFSSINLVVVGLVVIVGLVAFGPNLKSILKR